MSLALNNRPGVSARTPERVWQAAREAGFDFARRVLPQTAERGRVCMLVCKKSGAVLADTPFFSALTEGVLAGCRRCGFELVVRELYADEGSEGQIYVLRKSGFAGFLLLATEMDAAGLTAFAALNAPLVVLDAYFDEAPCDCVRINNTQGAFLATAHLLSRCKQPGYLRSAYRISNFEARADGFYRAVRSRGLSASRCPVHALAPSQEGAYADMKALLQAGEALADGYFADNDLLAAGAIAALREAGYRIPEDVAVVGFDDMPLCESLAPPLTTIRVPKRDMGEIAVQRLAQRIERPEQPPLKSEVSTALGRRRST